MGACQGGGRQEVVSISCVGGTFWFGRFLRHGIALLFVVLAAGCSEDDGDTGEVTQDVPDDALVLAVHPYDTPSRLAERFQPLCDHLSERLGRPVELYVAVSYEDQIQRIASGEVDLAYIGPTPYLRARDKFADGPDSRIAPIVGEREYFSVLVARADSDVHTVADLKGRTVAFGSHRSFSSHYMPRAMLLKAGVRLGDLKDYTYLDRHERVALAVLHGDYDAGGLNRDVARQYTGRGRPSQPSRMRL